MGLFDFCRARIDLNFRFDKSSIALSDLNIIRLKIMSFYHKRCLYYSFKFFISYAISIYNLNYRFIMSTKNFITIIVSFEL